MCAYIVYIVMFVPQHMAGKWFSALDKHNARATDDPRQIWKVGDAVQGMLFRWLNSFYSICRCHLSAGTIIIYT